jgi:hypothetical protein
MRDKRRRNPIFDDGTSNNALVGMASDALVSNALRGCSANEKLLIAGLIPMLVKALRELPDGGEMVIIQRGLPVATVQSEAKPS